MPARCVAAGCSNTHSDGISLHKFPRDPVLREEWTKQVQRTRAQWKPSASSVLCSSHFTDDCFEPESNIAAQFGIKKARRLKPTAIPSIFSRKRAGGPGTASKSDDHDVGATGTRSKRAAYEKRERSRVRIALGVS